MTGKLSVSEGGQCGAESPRRGCFPRARKHHNSSADGGEWSRQTTPCPVTSHNQCDPSPPNASVACVNRFKSNAHNTAQESFRLVHDEKAFLSEGAIVLPTIEWNGSMAARERNTRRTSTRDGPTHVPSKHHSLCLQCCPSGSEEPLDMGWSDAAIHLRLHCCCDVFLLSGSTRVVGSQPRIDRPRTHLCRRQCRAFLLDPRFGIARGDIAFFKHHRTNRSIPRLDGSSMTSLNGRREAAGVVPIDVLGRWNGDDATDFV